MFSLCRALKLPNYVHQPTRSAVLKVYKDLLRASGQCEFAFVRNQLRHVISHAFHSCRYVTAPNRIQALLHIAGEELQVLGMAFTRHSLKDYQFVLDTAFRSYKVTNSPLWKLFKPVFHPDAGPARTAATPLYRTLLECRVVAVPSLCYDLNNAQIPSHGTIDAFKRAGASSDERYFRLVRLLRKNRMQIGRNGRKIGFDPPLKYTALGEPASPRRQRNAIKRTCMLVLRDAPKPVHPDVLEFLNSARGQSRFVRRRLQECAEQLYSVNDAGQVLRAKIFTE